MMNTFKTNRHRPDRAPHRGSAFIMMLIYVMIVGVLAGTLTTFATFQRNMNARYTIHEQEMAAAELAVNKIISQIIFYGNYKPVQVGGAIENFHTSIQQISAPAIPGFTISEVAVTPVSSLTHLDFQLINDPNFVHEWQDYPGQRLVYDITVRARKNDTTAMRLNHPGVKLQRRVEALNIPLYVFGIFYDNELEVWPGPAFDMFGRVHSNCKAYVPGTDPPQYVTREAWLGAGNVARYHNRLTFVGPLRYGRHPDAGQGSPQTSNPSGANKVQIANGVASGSGDYPYELQDMYDTAVIDSAREGWYDLALNRWNGFLRDSAFGVKELRPPIPPVVPIHAMIERADPEDDPGTAAEKFENKADLKIIRNASTGEIEGFDKNGNQVNLTYPDPNDSRMTKSIVAEGTWFDRRENKRVRTIDLNIANLIEAQSHGYIDIDNGIVYISEYTASSSELAAARVINGATLPSTVSGGFTVATDGPIYVKGDFNIGDNRIPALIAGDAINILSNAWQDSLNQTSNHSMQMASATETNAVFMGGNVPSADGHYSGGAENYFRYQENWSKIQHKFRGSILNLWSSQKAVGRWPGTGTVYNPPNRNWGWDSILSGVTPPPGMVNVFQVNALDWKIVTSD
ncbi:MAG: hypothetical protein Kow0059_05540 [Candidatus Sumerlaeia bacterium]